MKKTVTFKLGPKSTTYTIENSGDDLSAIHQAMSAHGLNTHQSMIVSHISSGTKVRTYQIVGKMSGFVFGQAVVRDYE